MDSNFRDDFTLLLGLLDAQGSPIDWPDADFCGELSTRGLQRFAFGRAGGVLTNCRPASLDECGENAAAGMLLVSAKAHGLPPGQVKASVTFALPDPDMPGGFRSVTVKWPSDRGAAPEPVRLTTGPSSPDGSSLATVLMPTPLVVRTAYQLAVAEGYEGTAEDYMAALTALPEAVAEAQAAAVAEEGRVAAEAERVAAEENRETQEISRELAEGMRAQAEQKRASYDSQRSAAETDRRNAEKERFENEMVRKTSESERQQAEAARDEAETARVGAEDGRALAEASRVQAETDRAEAWNTLSAEAEAKIAATADALEVVEPFAATVAQTDKLARDLAQYDDEAPIELVVEQSGKCIDTGGAVVTKSGYGVSGKVRLRKGYVYLYRTADGSAIDTGVALCARLTSEPIPVVIDYIYEYDEQGRIVTATAMYDATKVYTYAYDASGALTITDAAGEVVDELPTYRVVGANEYAPMLTALSDSVPHSGYYAVVCNTDCEAVWSAPAPLGQVLVVSYGVIRSLANSKADRADVEPLKEQVVVNTENIAADKEAEDYRFAELLENTVSGTEKGYLYAKIMAGTTCYGVEAHPTRDTWVWLPKPTYNHADNAKILEVAYVGAWTALGNATNLMAVKGYEVSKKTPYLDYLFQNSLKLKKIDLSACPRTSKYDMKRSTFADCTALEELLLPKAGVVMAGGSINAAWATFRGLSSLKHLDVSMCDTSEATCLWQTFGYCTAMDELDCSAWDVRRLQVLDDTFSSMFNLRWLDLRGWDTRSLTEIKSMTFRWARSLYVAVSPSYFCGKAVLGTCGATSSFGCEDGTYGPLMNPKDPTDTRNWLEMLAETAPTIRLMDGWDQEAWDADPLEENEETPTLLTEEDGMWYLNDGVARSIRLQSQCKSKDWAQAPIALLQEKGYTIV